MTSPGMLYGGLTLEEAMSGRSKIRNRAIAEVFSRMEIVESWGTGLRRIVNRAKEYDLPEPKFQEIGDTFRVSLYRKADEKPIEADEKPIETYEKPIKADRKQMVLNYVREKGSISNKEAREFLNLAESTTKRVLKQMVDAKILKVEGSNRTRRYYEDMKKL